VDVRRPGHAFGHVQHALKARVDDANQAREEAEQFAESLAWGWARQADELRDRAIGQLAAKRSQPLSRRQAEDARRPRQHAVRLEGGMGGDDRRYRRRGRGRRCRYPPRKRAQRNKIGPGRDLPGMSPEVRKVSEMTVTMNAPVAGAMDAVLRYLADKSARTARTGRRIESRRGRHPLCRPGSTIGRHRRRR
jgi:hypothetical protein